MRENSVLIKLNAVAEVVKGQRIIMVDDSIVRGTTSKQIVQMLRDAGSGRGAYGSGFTAYAIRVFTALIHSRREELIAGRMAVSNQAFIGADSLHYLSIEGMFSALKGDAGSFCAACFSGDYPVPVDGYDAATSCG